MRRLTWWQLGLMGGVVLSITTVIKVIHSIKRFFTEDVPWSELLYFPAQIFLMGFACGVVVWLVLPLSKKLGTVGDAAVGVVTMLFFFIFCMLIFDPSLIIPNPLRGLPMFGIAIAAGIFLGVSIGKDFRKFIEEQKASQVKRI